MVRLRISRVFSMILILSSLEGRFQIVVVFLQALDKRGSESNRHITGIPISKASPYSLHRIDREPRQ